MYGSGKSACRWAADCLRREPVLTSAGLNGLPVGVALAVRAEPFSAALAKRSWVIRQKGERRAHLLLLQSDRGTASWQGTTVALNAPALLWLPNNLDASIEVGAGADGLSAVDRRRFSDQDHRRLRRGAAPAARHRSRHADRRRHAVRASARHHAILPRHRGRAAHARFWRRRDDRLASAAAVPASVAARRRAWSRRTKPPRAAAARRWSATSCR